MSPWDINIVPKTWPKQRSFLIVPLEIISPIVVVIIVQTNQTKIPICVSYLTKTMPIMGVGVGPASFLSMPMENTGCYSGNICADILIFANANEPKIFVNTPAGGCLFYGQIINIQ